MLLLFALAHARAMVDDSATVAWLRATALPLKTVEAGNGFDDLERFGKSLDSVQIVGMGEPTHGTREAFLFKHRMFEYLVERKGYRIFGMEASYPDCLPIEKYIQTGEGDPEKVVHGQGFWTWDTEEVLGLVQWMRAYNASHPDRVHFVGFDMQNKASAYARVVDYLGKWLPANETHLPTDKPTAKDIQDSLGLLNKSRTELVKKSGAEAFETAWLCAVVAGQASVGEVNSMSTAFETIVKVLEKAKEESKALKQLGWQSKDLDDVLAKVENDTAGSPEVRAAMAKVQSQKGAVPSGAEATYGELLKNLGELAKQLKGIEESTGWRDKCMAENTAWIVNELYPRSKAMLWAHNYHVGSSVPTDNAVETMGRHLTKRFGKAYFPVGFCFGDGSFQSRLIGADKMGPLQAFDVGPATKDSLDVTFGKAGSLFIVAFDRAPKEVRQWLDQPHPTRNCGAGFDPGTPEMFYRKNRPGAWFRAMVYLGTTTRARPLPLTRERFGIKKDW